MNDVLQTAQTHPSSLRVFLLTEMWERYGFYVTQSLLALFLAIHFKWPDKDIYFLVASFTALNYLTPLAGGWLADKWLGQKKAVLIGGLILLLSYFTLSFIHFQSTLTASLAGIAVGTGLLKPNISALLGHQYPANSLKRDSGFTLFYMGLATGIILGTSMPSVIRAYWGWDAAFLSASFAMLLAIVIFSYGISRHNIKDYQDKSFKTQNIKDDIFIFLSILISLFLLWALCYATLTYSWLSNYLVAVVVIWLLGYFIITIKSETAFQARQTLVIALLCLTSILFWAFYFQMFTSLTLFILRVGDTHFLGIDFYPPYYISIQSIGLIIFGFLLSKKKQKSNLVQNAYQTADKFLFSILFITMAYVGLVLICNIGNAASLISPLYFIPIYLAISLAEMLLSPVGLSAVSLLAHNNKVSTMVGIFFVTLGMGAFLSGKLANLTLLPPDLQNVDLLKQHYSQAFTKQLYILLSAFIGCMVINITIKRLLKTEMPSP